MLADLLRDELLAGALPPGAPLRDTELAERASVSRGTAREALAELAREGLVVQTLHRGVRVASPTEADVADVYGARRVLEGAGLEALLASPALGPLRAAIERMAAARGVPEGVEADAAFHLAIVAATGVERLVAAAERALREVRLVLCAADRATADLDALLAGHVTLIDAIAAGDAAAARAALRGAPRAGRGAGARGGSRPVTRLLRAADVRALITPADALDAVREAFVRLERGEATVPPILDFVFDGGEAHVKGAWLHGDPFWSVKAATGFAGVGASGVSVVMSARDGRLAAVVIDGGLLTELRTAAAGALAASLLARPSLEQVCVVGAGGQARFQVEALLGVREVERVVVWARREAAAAECARDLTERFGVRAAAFTDLEAAVRGADLVVTVTPSTEPLVRSGWLSPGAHLTAVGSDMPGKQEVEAAVLGAADMVVADHPPVAAVNGELQHALAAGEVRLEDVPALGTLPRRARDSDVTVCDLVGIGVQDAAIAGLVVSRAIERDVGLVISPV